MNAWTLGCAVSFLLLACTGYNAGTGCSSPDAILETVRRIHGPSDNFAKERERTVHDLNGDGLAEVIIVYGRKDRGLSLADLKDGVVCDGFAVLSPVDWAWWPVYYVFDGVSRTVIRLGRIDDLAYEQLVRDGGRGHTQSVWGWYDILGTEEDHPPAWWAGWRRWDKSNGKYSTWHTGRFYSVHVGK